jgi:glycosyltransferase involved in cell wall biosynthesis
MTDEPTVRPKICLFCVTSSRSGIGDGFVSLANSMPPETDIVILKGDSYENAEFTVSNDRICSVSFSIQKPMSYLSWRSWSKLMRFIRHHDVQHIFFYSTAPINSLALMLLRHVSYSLWCHDPIPHPGEPLRVVMPKELDQRLLLRGSRCKRIFVCSHAMKRLLVEHRDVSSSRITCYPLPVIEEITKHAKRQPYADRKYDIIFWGRIEAYKGLDILGSALNILRRKGVTFSALIAGRGPIEKFLPPELLAVPSVVIKNEYVENRELAADICGSKIAVFPYRSSTGTHTVQTSLAMGCRVVASDVGSFRELLTTEDTVAGELVLPEDPAALANALEAVLALPDCEPYAAERFADQFAPTRWAAAIAKDLEQE